MVVHILGAFSKTFSFLNLVVDYVADEGEEFKDAAQAFGLGNSVAVRTIH